MREILFRGKRADDGSWVKGFLYKHEPPLTCFLPNTKESIEWYIVQTGFANLHMPRPVRLLKIDISTAGQYTGLTDKNGQKIFEGDIVHQYNEGLDNEYLYDLRVDIGRVFWYQEGARFSRTSKLFPNDRPEICAHCEYEVVGNIYDNPELLESSEEEKQ